MTEVFITAYIVGYVIYYLAIRYWVSRNDDWTVGDRSIALLSGIFWPIVGLFLLFKSILDSTKSNKKAGW